MSVVSIMGQRTVKIGILLRLKDFPVSHSCIPCRPLWRTGGHDFSFTPVCTFSDLYSVVKCLESYGLNKQNPNVARQIGNWKFFSV